MEGCLLLKVVLFGRLSSIIGCLPSKVIFHWMAEVRKGFTLIDRQDMVNIIKITENLNELNFLFYNTIKIIILCFDMFCPVFH